MKLIYPAIFYKEDNSFYVEFPDLEGCQSFGDTIDETYENSKEALSLYCENLLENGKKLPTPTPLNSIIVEENSFTSLVETKADTKSKAIKKTLTIPSWLNDLAIENQVNFSKTLQNALIKELNIQEF